MHTVSIHHRHAFSFLVIISFGEKRSLCYGAGKHYIAGRKSKNYESDLIKNKDGYDPYFTITRVKFMIVNSLIEIRKYLSFVFGNISSVTKVLIHFIVLLKKLFSSEHKSNI